MTLALTPNVKSRPCAICANPLDRVPKAARINICLRCAFVTNVIQKTAAGAVAQAVKAGRMPRARERFCVDCARPASDYDHREYSKPLAVEPVCRRCNLRRGPALDLYALARSRLHRVS